MRWIRNLWQLLALAALLLPAAAEGAGRKVALIIANSNYAHAGRLANPRNDGELVKGALRRSGFTTVTVAPEVDIAAFQRVLRDFRDQANGADVALVYYTGHGIEASGRNWLIPIDAVLSSPLDLPYEAIELDRAMEAIAGASVKIVMLDACRNNPFGRSWRSAVRSVTRGLARYEADDILVIYAAAPGQTASDGIGENSPFAISVARRIAQPGLPIQMLGGAVRDDVLAATGGSQRPFISASITGTPFYIVEPAAVAASQNASEARPLSEKGDARQAELDVWERALLADSPEGFTEYLRAYPRGKFANVAHSLIARLAGKAGGPAIQSTTTIPAQSASTTVGLNQPAVGADEALAQGVRYEDGTGVPKDEAQAVRWYRIAAEAGNVTGMVYYADMLRLGKGVERNFSEALIWYRKAADAGNAGGMTGLGQMYDNGQGASPDYGEAKRWYRRAAELGNAVAMTNLGYMYEMGHGQPRDDAQAVQWYRLAADAGQPTAMKNLAVKYQAGQGVPRNDAEAVRWYRRAADLGQTSAKAGLGYMYHVGRGVPRDYVEAVKLYREAAAAGDTMALSNLALCYEKGEGVAQDYAEAARLYRRAADGGDAPALSRLAWMYEEGKGVAQDYAQSVQLYRKAAQAGTASAMTSVGYAYEKGRGVPQDKAKALEWYRRAADAGDGTALTNVGVFYENGTGVTKDYARAVHYYRAAAEAGNKIGMRYYADMLSMGQGTARDPASAAAWRKKAAALEP